MSHLCLFPQAIATATLTMCTAAEQAHGQLFCGHITSHSPEFLMCVHNGDTDEVPVEYDHSSHETSQFVEMAEHQLPTAAM